MKERRELSAGSTREEAIERFPDFNDEAHDCERCPQTGIWQVFRKRGPKFDPTIRKAIFRQTAADFRHYRRKIVVGFEPGDIITFRLKGTRKVTAAPIEKLYATALQWEAFAAMNAKRIAKAAKRKAKRAA